MNRFCTLLFAIICAFSVRTSAQPAINIKGAFLTLDSLTSDTSFSYRNDFKNYRKSIQLNDDNSVKNISENNSQTATSPSFIEADKTAKQLILFAKAHQLNKNEISNEMTPLFELNLKLISFSMVRSQLNLIKNKNNYREVELVVELLDEYIKSAVELQYADYT